MADVARSETNTDDEQPDLQSDVARLVESAKFNKGHARKVRRLLNGMMSGCIVIVVEDGGIPVGGIYQVRQFTLGPAE